MKKLLILFFSLVAISTQAQDWGPQIDVVSQVSQRNAGALYNGPYNRPFVTTRNSSEANSNASFSNGTDLLQTYKVKRVATQTCTDIQLVYANTASDPISYTVVVQTSGGTNYPIYFQGRRNPTVDGGGYIISDPISINLVKGDFIWVVNTVGVSVSGRQWYKPQIVNDAGGGAATAGSDFSSGGGSYSQLAVVHGPVGVIGRTNDRVAVVAFIGDSIMYGSGNTDESGYMNAFGGNYAPNISAISMAQGGAVTTNFTQNSWKKKVLLASCTAAICEYGVNDIWISNATLSALQTSTILLWRQLAFERIRAFQTTLTPRTTSTDSWATTANQTISDATKEAVRVNYNNWLRDGAPVDGNFAPVAVGTTTAGTLRIGMALHPLVGYFDVADQVETARDSGRWKNSITTDGIHMNTTGNNLAITAINTTQVLQLP